MNSLQSDRSTPQGSHMLSGQSWSMRSQPTCATWAVAASSEAAALACASSSTGCTFRLAWKKSWALEGGKGHKGERLVSAPPLI